MAAALPRRCPPPMPPAPGTTRLPVPVTRPTEDQAPPGKGLRNPTPARPASYRNTGTATRCPVRDIVVFGRGCIGPQRHRQTTPTHFGGRQAAGASPASASRCDTGGVTRCPEHPDHPSRRRRSPARARGRGGSGAPQPPRIGSAARLFSSCRSSYAGTHPNGVYTVRTTSRQASISWAVL